MKWIKASERKPEHKKQVFIKAGFLKLAAWWDSIKEKWYYQPTLKHRILNPSVYDSIFWLDESEEVNPSTPTNDTGANR